MEVKIVDCGVNMVSRVETVQCNITELRMHADSIQGGTEVYNNFITELLHNPIGLISKTTEACIKSNVMR
jgi:transcription elongation factor Elf1